MSQSSGCSRRDPSAPSAAGVDLLNRAQCALLVSLWDSRASLGALARVLESSRPLARDTEKGKNKEGVKVVQCGLSWASSSARIVLPMFTSEA